MPAFVEPEREVGPAGVAAARENTYCGCSSQRREIGWSTGYHEEAEVGVIWTGQRTGRKSAKRNRTAVLSLLMRCRVHHEPSLGDASQDIVPVVRPPRRHSVVR